MVYTHHEERKMTRMREHDGKRERDRERGGGASWDWLPDAR